MKKRRQSKEVQALEARISTLENVVQYMDSYLRQLDAHMHMESSTPQVDAGAALDLNLDTTEKGELDALALQEQGLQQDYMKRVEAWNLREQAVQPHYEGGR